MKPKVNRTSFNRSQAEDQFSQYKETGKGKIIKINQNKLGWSEAYDEGWSRIFGPKDETQIPET